MNYDVRILLPWLKLASFECGLSSQSSTSDLEASECDTTFSDAEEEEELACESQVRLR